MTVEHIIIAAIVAAVLFYTLRSLVRTWRGKSDGGCGSCPGCGDHRLDDEAANSDRQAKQSENRSAK